LWKGCFDNREIITNAPEEPDSCSENRSLLILGSYQNEKTSLYCLDMQENRQTGKYGQYTSPEKNKKESRNSFLSVTSPLKPDEALYLCARDAGKASASCVF
jgi:hypothetical protein